jgi:hypothetical protein
MKDDPMAVVRQYIVPLTKGTQLGWRRLSLSRRRSGRGMAPHVWLGPTELLRTGIETC